MKKTLCLLLICVNLAAEISVSVSRDVVKMNESIQVVFKSDQKIRSQPDFSPLEQDFQILAQNQGSSTRIINGHVENEHSWTLTLMSKKEGLVTIPSLRFGTFQSEPLTLHVTEATAPVKGDPLFFEVEITPSGQIYEQSQLIYTMRFFRAVNLYNGRITDLNLSDSDAIVEKLGEDKEYDQMAGGIKYLVLERKYAVFPQHAGELTFAPIIFEGQIVTSGRSVFNMQTQHTQLSSDPLKISVLPIPPPFTRQNWLAASQVKLVDEWSGDITKVKAGEPITRTVTIMADGCLASQIPGVNIPVPENLKQYPDKPQTFNQLAGSTYTGIKQIKIALISSEPGSITLPEIQVSWWDTKANKPRVSSLPELQLQVIDDAPAQIADAQPVQPVVAQPLPLWAWILIGSNGVWLVGIAAWLLKNRKPRARKVVLSKEPTLSQIKQSLMQACKENSPKSAELALLAWSKIVYTVERPLNLAALMECVSGDLKDEIEDLIESLYSAHHLWNGKELWEAFNSFKPTKIRNIEEKNMVLKDLYR